MNYPQIYHEACHHLIAYGGHGGNRLQGRKIIAQALRALRAKFGRERAQAERRGLLFIAGHFPLKTL